MSSANARVDDAPNPIDPSLAEQPGESTVAGFQVLVHQTGRYAIWPGGLIAPTGWRVALSRRGREECLAFVREHWSTTRAPATKAEIGFALMFFGGGEDHSAIRKYELIVRSARLADARGFQAVWLPERHFNPFGCLYPNPVVLHAALARETKHIRLRAGSVVLPLHQALRVAEDWAIVDNLSRGRVEISFAPGWSPDDFALFPERYHRRYDELYEGLNVVRRLWRGETVRGTNGLGEPIELRTYPRPIQRELPVWITAAQSDESFRRAGAVGANLLTHLFDQDVDVLADKIGQFRQARRDHGHDPHGARVAVALHTFVAASDSEVQAVALPAYARYLKANLNMLKSLAVSRGRQLDLSGLTGRELDEAIQYLVEKFLADRSLLGTVDSCDALVRRLAQVGVSEVACLVDFGPDPEAIESALENLCRLKERFSRASSDRREEEG